jgi:hypothetical protein
MREVWKEIGRRRGGVGRGGQYVHPARPEGIRACPQFQAVEKISQQPDERDRVQEQAGAVLFLVVTGHCLWNRRSSFGPRTRTLVEANRETVALNELSASHEQDANKYDLLGNRQAARILRELAADSRNEAELRHAHPDDAWIVKRSSSRCGDDWDRGLIIEIAQTCCLLFRKLLLGTVATLSNVALDRKDLTKGAVQGVVKHFR